MKVTGKDLKFLFDGKEYPVQSADFSVEYDTSNVTDSSTSGNGKEFMVGRADRSINIETFLFAVNGAQLISGDELEKDKIYRVDQQGENLAYDVGFIFTANGNEVLGDGDKCTPLGAKLNTKDMDLSLNNVAVGVTDIEFSEKYDEIFTTDTNTPGDAKEGSVSRAEADLKISAFIQDSTADLLAGTPTDIPFSVSFATTQLIFGTAKLTKKNNTGSVENAIKGDYELKCKGQPTVQNIGLSFGVEKPFKIIYRKGGTTDKAITGTAIINQRGFKGNIDKPEINASYVLMVTGTPTETVYA